MGLDATRAMPLARLAELVGNSMWLGALASGLVTLTAVVTTYAVRRDGRAYIRAFMRIAQFGYAVPGVVIAVGILIAIGAFDRIAGGAMGSLLGFAAGLVLSGTIAAVLYGYLTRFFAIASSAVEAGFTRIRFSFDDAARTLGEDPFGVLRRIHLPLLRGSLSSAALLVFVEVMKELPATMILRPFNFDTLAIEAFQLATTERLDGAALPSLVIVAVGLLPVIALCRSVHRSRPGERSQS
jgi:iron(III) transport system permease protein